MVDQSGSGQWQSRRVLVTGATGFLGRHLVPRLATVGATVVALSRSGAAVDGAERAVALDLEDPQAIGRFVRELNPDVVFHLGGRVYGAPDAGLVRSTFATLLASSIELLAATEAGDVGRLVLAGSTDEGEAGVAPASPYGAAKAALSTYAKLYGEIFGAAVVNIRLTEVFGPGQAPSKLLPYAAAAALRGERPRLSSGRRRGDWTYVADAVDGMVTAAQAAPDGSEIDVGTGVLRANREMVEGVLAHLGTAVTPHWGALPDRPAEPERPADTERTARLLGWRATTPHAEGLRRTADAARRMQAATSA